MKKLMLLGAVVALAASGLPGAAAAARFSGVVVAKDTARHTLAVVTGNQVRTVRTTKAKVVGAAVGSRVAVKGTRYADGTFSGQTVRKTGKATQVRFGAVVVRHDTAKQQLIVSAGGTVFGLRYTGTSFTDDNPNAGAGDEVTVSADVKGGGLDAGDGDVTQTGHVGQVKIVGIYLSGGQDGFNVAIVHRGLVRVHFTLGTQLPAWQPGDVIVLLVTVNADGSFTLVQGQTDANPGDDNKGSGDNNGSGDGSKTTPPAPTYVDASGVLSNKTSTTVTVTRADTTTLTCNVGTVDVSSFAVGAKVGMYCKRTDGGLALVAIKSLDPPPPPNTPQTTSFAGKITALGDSVSVQGDGSAVGTCTVPQGVSLAIFHVGDTVKMNCVAHDSGLVLVGLGSSTAWINLGTGEVGLVGKLADDSATGVTVSTDTSSLHCSLATPVDFSLFAVGDTVALSCKRTDGGGFAFNLLYGKGAQVSANGAVQRTVAGTLTAVGGGNVTVTLEDHSTVTCSYPAVADLSAFHVGDQVKMRCNLVSGQWQLSLLASATATVEIH
jgi:hypothetical protein